MSGIDTYDLPELDEDEAVALLAGHGVVRTVALRLSASVSGNPLALVELAQLLDDGQRQGLAPLPDPLPMTTPEAAYVALLTALPERACVAVAVAGLAGNVSTVVLADALACAGSDFAVADADGRAVRLGRRLLPGCVEAKKWPVLIATLKSAGFAPAFTKIPRYRFSAAASSGSS